MNMNIPLFANYIFSSIPRPPCTLVINFNLSKGDRNKILWIILVTGAKKIYGPQITIDNLQPYQFFLLDKYIQSLGYKIKYDTCLDGILIWFEQINIKQLCNGTKLIEF